MARLNAGKELRTGTTDDVEQPFTEDVRERLTYNGTRRSDDMAGVRTGMCNNEVGGSNRQQHTVRLDAAGHVDWLANTILDCFVREIGLAD